MTGRNQAPDWRFLCAAEIVNFAELRRMLGVARAERLMPELVDRLTARLPAARINATARAAIEFTFGGEQFADVETALVELQTAFAAPVEVHGDQVVCELALAGAGAPAALADEVRLAEEVEEAIELARTERRIIVRDLSVQASAVDRLTLMRDLANAAANGEMTIHYQPKIHVRQQKVTSVEALIRWRHPTRGMILPGDFIPAAEQSGEIAALTLWTLDQVIADHRRLAERGFDLVVFVNISGPLLGDTQFAADAAAKVEASGARIGFEITETAVIRDPETAIANLQRFADTGIPIAIDDYGAGLSSLAYLKQLPASELKIDKMFVTQLTSSNRDPLIVRSTIDLAHALEMEVTAEGVETQAALALLSVMGCDMVQGFLISRPVPFDALVEFLAEEHRPLGAEALRGSFDRPASFWKSA